MLYNVSTDNLITEILLLCIFSPVFIWIFAFLIHSLVRFNINSLKRNSTPEQFQEYIDNYNWKYSVEFFFPQMTIVRGIKKLRKSPIYFSQVSKSDSELFENWLLKNDASILEFKDHLGSIIQVNRNSISSQRIRIEAIPRKVTPSRCLHAIYEEDGTLIHTFEYRREELWIQNTISKFWILPIIFGIALPKYITILIPLLISYSIWNSYNMPYLFKKYPLCMLPKIKGNKKDDFFRD